MQTTKKVYISLKILCLELKVNPQPAQTKIKIQDRSLTLMRRFSGRMKLVWHVPAEPPWGREGVQASEVPKSALSLRNPTWSSPTVSRSPSTVWSGTRFPEQIHTYIYQTGSDAFLRYWVTKKLPQICIVIFRIRIGKVAFAVYICGNFWVPQ